MFPLSSPRLLLAALSLVSVGAAADLPPSQAMYEVEKVTLHSIPLWAGPAPQARGTGSEDRPQLDVFLAPKDKATGAAVIVCPGGGYWLRAMDHEGMQVAQWFNSQGIHAFVLSYRVRSAGYEPPAALLDAQRALRLVRARAEEFGVDPRRLGMMGFSAGAHLASWAGERFDAGDPKATDPVERRSSRPDFVVIVYGGPSQQPTDAKAPRPLPVTKETPPTFMQLTTTDMVDPAGCLQQLLALRKAGVEAELHVFGGDGGHGRGLHVGDPDTGMWPTLLMNWLRRNAVLTDRPRASVAGKVTIDGRPLFLGWVTLRPADEANLPSASIYLNDRFRERTLHGTFQIESRFGPVPGRYRVEVRQLGWDLLLVPTINEARTFTSLVPGGEPILVEIKPGGNTLDLAIRTK